MGMFLVVFHLVLTGLQWKWVYDILTTDKETEAETSSWLPAQNVTGPASDLGFQCEVRWGVWGASEAARAAGGREKEWTLGQTGQLSGDHEEGLDCLGGT